MILFRTPRLRVVAINAEAARLALEDRQGLERAVGACLDPAWPLADMKGLLSVLRTELERRPGAYQYGGLIVFEAEEVVVGDVGFHQLEGDIVLRERAAELGYSVVPRYRGLGIATEAAEGMVRWGFARLGLLRVYAHCDRDNFASARVLEKAGFALVPAGLDRIVLYERVRNEAQNQPKA